jgi:4-amino-4-deoxy-L-arabinose transferase-like glycosyltransferase
MIRAGLLTPRTLFLMIGALFVLRIVAAAALPLSADEAYYWLWSKRLAAGYYDHPPAIAFLIRAGTSLFGDDSLGVRFGSLVLSIAAGGFVWRAGAAILDDEKSAALGCLLFNLTPMAAIETMAATPDAPLIAASAAFLYALAKLDRSADGRWWLAAGAAGGLALLSKYTGFFLGLGALAWLLTARGRPWWRSPWLYVGGLVALIIFAPNLVWNAIHGWETFAFQFGRIGRGGLTLRYIVEFAGAQLLLASPFVLVCAVIALIGAPRRLTMVIALILPAALVFAAHALFDRVQGNWPCFLYPALAVAAALAASPTKREPSGFARWSLRLAIPTAVGLLALIYLQAFFDVIPLGRADPTTRLLAYGFSDVVRDLDARPDRPAAVLTSDYETTAWLAFYGHFPVIQVDESARWPDRPPPNAALLNQPLLYVAEDRRDRHALIGARFAQVRPLGGVDRKRDGRTAAHYRIYEARGFHGPVFGRMP